jgi:site-specific DNA recombinase
LQERIAVVENRLEEVRYQVQISRSERIDEGEARLALSAFDPVWGALTPREQARVLHLLVERVDYDGRAGKVSIVFRPTGIKTLARELSAKHEEMSV